MQSNEKTLSLSLRKKVCKGRLREVREIISSYGFSHCKEWSNGYVLLLDALKHRQMAVAKFLLEIGCVINGKKNRYYRTTTPLHLAVAQRCDEVVKILLEKGARIDVRDESGKTPLHIATKKRSKEVRKLLVEFVVRKSLLVSAVKSMDIELVELILQHSIDVNNERNRKCLIAAVNGKWEVCKRICERLLQYGFTVSPSDIGNHDFFFHAIRNGFVSIVEQLLKYGANVNHIWCSNSFDLQCMPLHYALICGQFEVAELLLTYKADVNARDESGRTPLFYAIKNGNLKIIHLLLSSVGNIKMYPELLILAIKINDIKIMKVLVEYGANVNFRDECGRTALYISPSNKNHMVYCGCTSVLFPIHVAAQFGNEEVVEALLECNADLNSICNCGLTPLHIAVLRGSEEVVKLLLKSGVVIDSVDKRKKTALHFACQNGTHKIVSALLDYGADINIADGNNRTPLHLAENGSSDWDFDSSEDDYESWMDDDSWMDDESLDEDYFRMNSYKKICHLLKLNFIRSMNLNVCGKNLKPFEGQSLLMAYDDECMAELEMLRSFKINSTVFSVYDILTKSIHQLSILLENENVPKDIFTDDCKTKFPIYARMLYSNIRMAEQRKELLKEVNDCCFEIFPGLTWDCIQLVFRDLSNADLCNLICACRLGGVQGHVSS